MWLLCDNILSFKLSFSKIHVFIKHQVTIFLLFLTFAFFVLLNLRQMLRDRPRYSQCESWKWTVKRCARWPAIHKVSRWLTSPRPVQSSMQLGMDTNGKPHTLQFVPRLLTSIQKQLRLEIYPNFQPRAHVDLIFLSLRFITEDETRICGDDPEGQQQSSQCT